MAGQDVELLFTPLIAGTAWARTSLNTFAPPSRMLPHGNPFTAARALAARNDLHLVRQLLVMEVNGRTWPSTPRLTTPLNTLNYTDSVQRWGKDWAGTGMRANNEAFRGTPSKQWLGS